MLVSALNCSATNYKWKTSFCKQYLNTRTKDIELHESLDMLNTSVFGERSPESSSPFVCEDKKYYSSVEVHLILGCKIACVLNFELCTAM